MKESFYFPHDTSATQDPKIMVLLAECGLAGLGMYWILIEILHQQEDGMITEEAYSHYIKFYIGQYTGSYEKDKIQQVLNTSGLLLNKDGFVYSERVLRNKEFRDNLSAKRSLAGKRSAEVRANPTCVKQVRTHVEQGKERKGKEKKENNINTITALAASNDEKQKKEPTRIYRICRAYYKAKLGKELDEEDPGIVKSFVSRNARSAKLLEPYPDDRIKMAIKHVRELSARSYDKGDGQGWDWSLETVLKKIDSITAENSKQYE